MKHLKIYEEKAWDYLKGYFVVVKSGKKKYDDYFLNNVGQVQKVYYPGGWFDVMYRNTLPLHVADYLMNKGEFNVADILFKSKSKEECEEYIDIKNNIKKYNI